MQSQTNNEWTEVIRPVRPWYNINISELWKYRDLIMIFVRRDFVSAYKQTVLGPLWFLIQPLITTLIFTLIFSRVAHVSTNNVPSTLFYLTGLTAWGYFAGNFGKTSGTFFINAGVFGKVYFPRLTVPVSGIISSLITFGFQFLLLICFWIYHYVNGANIFLSIYVLMIPFLLLIMALMSMGMGMIITSLTTKYKDLQFLVSFGVQLMMYATPIIYPLSIIPDKYKIYIWLNPMTSVIETFKFAMLGTGSFSWTFLGYSSVFTLVILAIGIVIFNKVEQRFIDTI